MILAALRAGKHVICEKPLVGSLAEIDEVIAVEKASHGPAHADLPVPLRQRHPAGQGDHRRRARRQALCRHRRDAVAARGRLLRRPLARQVEDRARRRADDARHPSARHLHLSDGRPQIAVRPRRHPRQPDRGRRLRLGLGRAAIGRARLVHRHARLGRRDHAASGWPSRTSPSKATTRPTIPAPPCGRSCRATTKTAAAIASAARGLDRRAAALRHADGALPRCRCSAAAPLPVTTADSRRALEIVTAFYPPRAAMQEVRFPDRPATTRTTRAGCRRVSRDTQPASCSSRSSSATATSKSSTASTSTSSRASSPSSSAPRAAASPRCLRMIAGLEPISGGELLIDGRRMNEVPAVEARHCDGVPVLCALSAYDRSTRTLPSASRRRACPRPRSSSASQHAAEILQHRAAAEAQAAPALRRPAPARRHRPRHRARAAHLPVRRAAQQSRRRTARADARRDRQAPPAISATP